MEKEKRGIFGSDLKIIAIVAMFIDHLAASFLQNMYMSMLPADINSWNQAQITTWAYEHPGIQIFNIVIFIMRLIGRFGFPIFAFLLVEGFIHTRNAKKYALRLGIFALISEIPFDLAFAGAFWYKDYQNVFLTLALAIVALIFIKFFEDKNMEASKPLVTVLGIIGTIAVGAQLFKGTFITAYIPFKSGDYRYYALLAAVGLVFAGIIMIATRKLSTLKKNNLAVAMCVSAIFMAIADLLLTDYGAWGVFTVVLIYLLRDNKFRAFAFACLGLTIMSPIEVTAFIMLPFVKKYNGKRGLSAKYFFYIFYPAHLGILYLAGLLLGYTGFNWIL